MIFYDIYDKVIIGSTGGRARIMSWFLYHWLPVKTSS